MVIGRLKVVILVIGRSVTMLRSVSAEKVRQPSECRLTVNLLTLSVAVLGSKASWCYFVAHD